MSELGLLVEAFRRNGRVNDLLLSAVTEADFGISDGQGGMSIGQLLEHLAGVRKVHLNRVGAKEARQISVQTEEGDQPFWTVTLSADQLKQAFAQADAAVLSAVMEAADGKQSFGSSFTSHPAQLLTLMLVHDAHHRGQIMTLLRQGGHTAEKMAALERATWPIWRE